MSTAKSALNRTHTAQLSRWRASRSRPSVESSSSKLAEIDSRIDWHSAFAAGVPDTMCFPSVPSAQEVVPELETLVGEQPLRESLRALLILSLYRSGRQAD